MDAFEFLRTVNQVISGDRQTDYGDPGSSINRMAETWSAVCPDMEFTPRRAVILMIATKLSRLAHNPNHMDSWVDVAGYAAIGAELCDEKTEDKDGQESITGEH